MLRSGGAAARRNSLDLTSFGPRNIIENRAHRQKFPPSAAAGKRNRHAAGDDVVGANRDLDQFEVSPKVRPQKP
jgi:hypothetical protein